MEANKPGTYVFNDNRTVQAGSYSWDDVNTTQPGKYSFDDATTTSAKTGLAAKQGLPKGQQSGNRSKASKTPFIMPSAMALNTSASSTGSASASTSNDQTTSSREQQLSQEEALFADMPEILQSIRKQQQRLKDYENQAAKKNAEVQSRSKDFQANLEAIRADVTKQAELDKAADARMFKRFGL